MAYVRSRKFCCCLPVRLGVLIIALLGIFGGSLIAVAGVIQAEHTKEDKLSLYVQIGVYILLAILSFVGLIGAIFRRRRMISAYVIMLSIHLAFSVITGLYHLYLLFHNAPTLVRDCINGSTDHLVIKSCHKGITVMEVVMVILFIVVWLVEIWGCAIVRRYREQLAEADSKSGGKDSEAGRPQW